ncbi:hypothetical protein GMSM_25870 [Geomonas sp. Red276]
MPILIGKMLSAFFMSLPVAWPGFLFIGLFIVVGMFTKEGQGGCLGCLSIIIGVPLVLYILFY